jgi:putative phage-type endonuclease
MTETQGTDAWFSSRLGCVTASRVADVMARTKSGYSASRNNYMMQLLCERLTGRREEGFTSAAMQRGIEMETVARSLFEMKTGLDVKEVGFIRHPNGLAVGASPDGITSDNAILEIKCPNTAQYLDCYLTGSIPVNYEMQMRLQMACAGLDRSYFVMFDDRLPERMQLTVKVVERHLDLEKEMMEGIVLFLEELDQLFIKLQGKQ